MLTSMTSFQEQMREAIAENAMTMEIAWVGMGCEVTKMWFDGGNQGPQLRCTFPLLKCSDVQ